MTTIYKYPLPVGDIVAIDMPIGAQVLSVHTQHGKPFIWALVDIGQPKETRRFFLSGTGHDMSRMQSLGVGRFIGTFLIHSDSLVFHLFEAVP